jgi:hypothetical protein
MQNFAPDNDLLGTSFVVTAEQGIEFSNPEAKSQVSTEDRYFSSFKKT